MQMNDGHYENLVVIDGKEDAVWEPREEPASCLLMDDWKLKWILLDSFEKYVQIMEKPNAQSSALALVSGNSFVNVDLGLAQKDQSTTHLVVEYFSRSRARTSSQGTVSSGFASY